MYHDGVCIPWYHDDCATASVYSVHAMMCTYRLPPHAMTKDKSQGPFAVSCFHVPSHYTVCSLPRASRGVQIHQPHRTRQQQAWVWVSSPVASLYTMVLMTSQLFNNSIRVLPPILIRFCILCSDGQVIQGRYWVVLWTAQDLICGLLA